MIINKNIRIKGNNSNIDHFKKLGYDIVINQFIEVKVEDLLRTSHVNVNVMCDICKKEKIISYYSYYRNTFKSGLYTCEKCSKIKYKITSLEKYGVEYPVQSKDIILKRKKNNIEKFGVDEPAKLKIISDKAKQTKKMKYGSENYNNSEKMKTTKKNKYGDIGYNNREKCEKTCLEKYGVKNVYQNENIINKKRETFLKHYGVDNFSKSDEFKENNKNKIINFFKNKNVDVIEIKNNIATLRCDNGKEHNYEIESYILRNRIIHKTILCSLCNPINSYTNSGKETQIQNFIKNNYDKEIILNNRNIIKPFELDIYLPDLKIGFEFNGLYWHNDINIPINYHLNKTELANKLGIKLIHIYEDDWDCKQDIVKSIILNSISNFKENYTENFQIKEINDEQLIIKFLNENYLYGYIKSDIKIGKFYKNDELVSLMIFKKINGKSKNNSYEMSCFCNKLNMNTLDGFDSIFKYFLNTYKPNDIVLFVNRTIGIDDMYEKFGFRLVDKIKPACYYVVGRKKIKDFIFQKNKISDKVIHKIYDSGYLKYIFKN